MPDDSTTKAESRRAVLQVIAVGVGGAAAGIAGSAAIDKLPTSTWRFLTEEEAALVDAVCEQIIPADRDSGAHEAGVVNFIDRQLTGPYQRFQQEYRAGLTALQASSRNRFQRAFQELAWDQQTELLKDVEAGRVPDTLWSEVTPREFFRLIRDHTMQGFYGSPRHGGNRGYASYQMLGLQYPRVIGQNRYEAEWENDGPV